MTPSVNMFLTVPLADRERWREEILKVLAYFDIFQYPLTNAEIRRYLGDELSDAGFDYIIAQLRNERVIFFHSGFYTLHDNPLLAHRRKEGNWRAARLMPRATRIGRFLFHFPFVRAVCISGSLSKNFADEKADIDFFIITKANRLWLARTIMHLFKKFTYLTGHQHFFCMNYYIDEQAMLIDDRNIYTAIEIATLVPVRGAEIMDRFFATNSWTARFFPAYRYQNPARDKPSGSLTRQLAEWWIPGFVAAPLDRWLQLITTNRWERKSRQGRCNKNGHTMRLITGRHFSRSNPGAFKERVLALYAKKLKELKIPLRELD